MRALDDIDRALVARLRDDGREPVSTLAAELHLARGTVQARLARLVEEGVIRRFTVEVSPEIESHTVRAITLIQLNTSTTRRVLDPLRRVPEVHAIHATNGAWDLVAEVVAGTLTELDGALVAIRAVPGVTNTETSILLRDL